MRYPLAAVAFRGGPRRWPGLLAACLAALLAGAAPAAALDWAGWLSANARESHQLRMEILNAHRGDLPKEIADIEKAVRESAKVSAPIPMEAVLANAPRVEGDALVLGEGRYPVNQKFDPKVHRDKLFAMGYQFTLPKESNFILYVFSDAMAVFHNGARLNYAGRRMWSNQPVYEIKGKAGANFVVVVPHWPQRDMGWARVVPGNTMLQAKTVIEKNYAHELRPEQMDQVGRFLLAYAEDSVVNGERLAAALIDWAEAIARQPKDKQAALNDRLADCAAEVVKRCWLGQDWEVYSRIADKGPAVFGWPLFYRADNKGRSLDEWLLRRLTSAAIRRGETARAVKMFTDIAAVLPPPEPSGKGRARDNWERLVRVVWQSAVEDAPRAGAYAYGVEMLDKREKWDREVRKVQPDVKNPNRDNYRRIAQEKEKLQWQMRVVTRLAPDPEAEQYFEEFKNKMGEGEGPTPESVAAIYRIFRRHGLALKATPSGLCAMRMEMIPLLKERKFYDALVQEANGRLGPDIDQAEKLGDLKSLTAILSNFTGLVPMDRLHKVLLREYYDRGDWQKAQYHAAFLAGEARDLPTRALGAAYRILLERALDVPVDARTPVPGDLASQQVAIGGRPRTLEGLWREVNGKAGRGAAAGGAPGRYLGTMDLGLRDTLESFSCRDFANNWTKFVWQPLEPVVVGDSVYVSNPYRTWCWRPGGKGWSYRNPCFHYNASERRTMTSFSGCADNGNVLFLANGESGGRVGLRAYSPEGRLLWDTTLATENAGWDVLCTPISAFGRVFALVGRSQSNNVQIALAEVAPGEGAFRNVIPVQNLRASLDGLRYGHRMVSDPTGIYGITGAGTVFGVNPDSLTLSWISAVTTGSGGDGAMSSPGFVGIFGENVVTYSPATRELFAVGKHKGEVRWRSDCPELRFVHSHGDSARFIFSAADRERSVLVCREPGSGRVRWSATTAGLRVTGEGAVAGESIYVPCENGIGVFSADNGKLTQFLPLAEKPLKVRFSGGKWAVLTERQLHLFAADGGAFEGAKAPAPQAAPAGAPAIAEAPTALPGVEQLRLVDKLPYPFSRRDMWTSNVLPIGGRFFAMWRDDVMGVYEEGRARDDGGWEPSRVLSFGHYPNLRVSPRFFATHTETTADFYSLPERRPVFSFAIPDCNGSPSGEHAIRHVRLSPDGLAVVLCHDARAVVIDLNARKILKAFPVDRDPREAYCFTRSHLVYMDGRGALRAVEPLTGKELWKIEKINNQWEIRCVWEAKEDGARVPWVFRIMQNGEAHMLDLNSGKFTKLAGAVRDPRGCWSGVKVRNFVAFGNGALVDCAAKKAVNDNVLKVVGFGRDALCIGWLKPKQGNAEAAISHFSFLTPQREIRLEVPPGGKGYAGALATNYSDSYVFAVGQMGERVYMFRGNNLYVYGLDGKLQEWQGFFTEEYRWNRVAFLRNSVLVQRTGDEAYLFSGAASAPGREPPQVTCAPTGGGRWPADGWLPLAEPGAWQLAPGQPRPQGYAYRFGANADRLFMELVAPPAESAPEAPQAFVRLQAHQNDCNPAFNLLVPVDANPGVCAPHERLKDRLESWQEVDAKGRRHCFLSIDKAAYTSDKDGAQTPRTHVEFELRRHGDVAARALVGGMACPGAGNFRFPAMDVLACQSDDNFQLREKLYANASISVPQGEDLLNWLAARRARVGAADNLKFLGEMLQRNKDHPAAANVLSAMLVERMAAFIGADPARPLSAPEVHEELEKAVREFKQQADGLGVNPAYSERGLTALAGYSMRNWGNVNERLLSNVAMRPQESNNKPNLAEFRIGARNPFTWNGADADFVVLPFGAFGGDRMTPSGIARAMFRAPQHWQRLQIGDWRLVSPAGSRPLIGRDGKPTGGIKLEKADGNLLLSAARGLWQAQVQPHGEIVMPELKFPDPPKARQAIAPKDLLLALEALPSDSRVGPSLADAYVRATTDPKNPVADARKPEDVYRLLLSKVITDWQQAEHACWKLREIYGQQNKNDQVGTLQKLSDVLRECGATRTFQRSYFIRANNHLAVENAWSVLGPFGVAPPKPAAKKEGGQDGAPGGDQGGGEAGEEPAPPTLEPLPEKLAEPLTASYSYDGKKGEFKLVKDKVGDRYFRTDNRPRNFYYALTTANLYDTRKPVKAYLHFRNEPWQRDRFISVKAWQRAEDPGNPGKFLDWEEVGSVYIPGADWTVRSLPVKLAPGKNQLLLRVEYVEQAKWHFNVGNVNAVPIRNLMVTK